MSYEIKKSDIAAELEFDIEDVEMLIEIFQENCNEYLDDLEKSINSNDLEQIFQASHSIKGSSANLRLDKIHDIAEDITESARVGLRNVEYKAKFLKLKELCDDLLFI